MAAKRLTLERKTIRTKFKDLHESYAESQTKYKSDQWKLRYRKMYVDLGGHFENCHGGRYSDQIFRDFASDIHSTGQIRKKSKNVLLQFVGCKTVYSPN